MNEIRYYWSLINQVPSIVLSRTERLQTAVGVAFFLLALLNRDLGKHVTKVWDGFSPWYAVVPIGVLVFYELLKSNYARFRRLEQALDGAEESEGVRRQLYSFLYEFAEPAFAEARFLLMNVVERLTTDWHGEQPLAALIGFAVVEPADDALKRAAVAVKGTRWVQRQIGLFCLHYERVRQSLDVILPMTRKWGGIPGDLWGDADGKFQAALDKLLANPDFAALRKVVRPASEASP
jgi:hypothetical protein